MTVLPRILVIDDQLGSTQTASDVRLRRDFCLLTALQDITGDVHTTAGIANPLAQAVFTSGQTVSDGYLRNDLAHVLRILREGWREHPRWSLVLLDMQFDEFADEGRSSPLSQQRAGSTPPYFGLAILRALSEDLTLRDVPVVILSSMSRATIEERLAEHGAFEFVDKTVLTRKRLEQLLTDYGLIPTEALAGRSIPFLKCLRDARRRAKIGDDNVLLLGDTGTGKELLGRYVHDCSSRSGGAYVTVYTQGVPEQLVDDRLFGHVKGGYTGAAAAQAGAAEEANGGTLFIDEFGDIPASIQSKLLRLLDKNTRESQRIGAPPTETHRLDLQVVLATNRLDILEADDFRKDLLFRVRIEDAIRIPNLAERREDIPLLAEFFLRKCERVFQDSLGAEPRTISTEAMQLLMDAQWPGNVRSLEQAIESAVYRFPKLRILSASHLKLTAKPVATTPRVSSAAQQAPQISSPLDIALAALETVEFTDAGPGRREWVGRLSQLQAKAATAAAKMLRAALLATRSPSAQNPDGELKIHLAVKLATGRTDITASMSADFIKRILGSEPKIPDELLRDPILAEAHAIALRLRPKGRRTPPSSAS